MSSPSPEITNSPEAHSTAPDPQALVALGHSATGLWEAMQPIEALPHPAFEAWFTAPGMVVTHFTDNPEMHGVAFQANRRSPIAYRVGHQVLDISHVELTVLEVDYPLVRRTRPSEASYQTLTFKWVNPSRVVYRAPLVPARIVGVMQADVERLEATVKTARQNIISTIPALPRRVPPQLRAQ